MALARSCRRLLSRGVQRPFLRALQPTIALPCWNARYVRVSFPKFVSSLSCCQSHRCFSSKEERLPTTEEVLKEIEPVKLPGRWAEYTGNVMYPDEESALWDVTRQLT